MACPGNPTGSSGCDTDTTLIRRSHEIGHLRQPNHQINVEDISGATHLIATTTPQDTTNANISEVEEALKFFRGDLLESVCSD